MIRPSPEKKNTNEYLKTSFGVDVSFWFLILKCIFEMKMCSIKIGLSWFFTPFWNNFYPFWETKKSIYSLWFTFYPIKPFFHDWISPFVPLSLTYPLFRDLTLPRIDLHLPSTSIIPPHCRFSSPFGVSICFYFVVMSYSFSLIQCSLSLIWTPFSLHYVARRSSLLFLLLVCCSFSLHTMMH